jgi:carboxyl-terminal processing protease
VIPHRLVAAALAGVLAIAIVARASQARETARASQVGEALATFDAAWRIIHETHFDPTFNGVDWGRVREELRPRAEAAATPDALRAVITEMLGRLGQSHFALIPGTTSLRADLSGSPGFEFRISGREAVVVSVDPDGPATATIKPGSTLVSIDGQPVEAILRPFVGASGRDTLLSPLRRFEAWRTITSHVRGPVGTDVELSFGVHRGGTTRATLRRAPEPGERVQVGSFPTIALRTFQRALTTPAGRSVGLIGFSVWMAPVDPFVQRAMDAFRSADGIVLDLRGNLGGLAAMVMGISGHFLGEPVLLGRMKTRDADLHFTANPRRVSANGAAVEPYAGRLAVLIDELTGSASECFTGALQSLGRARVFGTRSMGQALPALFDRLPNGDVLVHAFGDFVTASGVRLEGRGVVPDVEIPLSRGALAAGRDEPLDAALRWIDDDLRGQSRL